MKNTNVEIKISLTLPHGRGSFASDDLIRKRVSHWLDVPPKAIEIKTTALLEKDQVQTYIEYLNARMAVVSNPDVLRKLQRLMDSALLEQASKL